MRTYKEELAAVLGEADEIESFAKARGSYTDEEAARLAELATKAEGLVAAQAKVDEASARVKSLAAWPGRGGAGSGEREQGPLAKAVTRHLVPSGSKQLLPATPVATEVSIADITALPTAPTSLLSLVPVDTQLTATRWLYLRQVSRDWKAAVVPPTETKPTSEFELEQVEGRAVTVATLSGPYPNQWFADVTAIGNLLDNEVSLALANAVEDLVLNGHEEGTDPDADPAVPGILTTSGVQQQPFDTDMFTSVRNAIGKLTDIGVAPTAVVVSADDDRQWDLAQDQNARFYGQGPFGSGPATAWGRPRVVSTRLPAGTAIVGNFATALRLREREGVTILASTSSGDLFETNQTLIRGELRCGVEIAMPMSLVVVETGEESGGPLPIPKRNG